jgi:hypothetical protein
VAEPRPFSLVFLERVIRVDAVQCHRRAMHDRPHGETADDSQVAGFFAVGWLPGAYSEPRPWAGFEWSLDRPSAARPIGADAQDRQRNVWDFPRAWEVARRQWLALVAELRAGTLVVSGIHPISGARLALDPVEFTYRGRALNVSTSTLLDVDGRPLWTDLLVWEADPAPADPQSNKMPAESQFAAPQPAARNDSRQERAEQKRDTCQAAAKALIADNLLLANHPTTLARRVEQRCLPELQRLGHKKTKWSYKTVAGYLRDRK